MEEMAKTTFISLIIAIVVMFLVSHFSSPTMAEKRVIRNKMASEIYSEQVLLVNQCNFTNQFNNQRVQVISVYPLKILFNNYIYLYPGTWNIEYKDKTVILRSGSWYCIGSSTGLTK